MLKRKNSDYDVSDSSIFGDVPARMTSFKRKRLFRPKNSNKQQWAPQQHSNMSELLDFVLQHEEAFKKCADLPLYILKANIYKPATPCIAVCGLPAATRDQSRRLPCQYRSLDKSAD
jgi:hypothetical protein